MTLFEGLLLFFGFVWIIMFLAHIRMIERHLERRIDDQRQFHDQRFKDSEKRFESNEKYLQDRMRHLEERIDRRPSS